MRRNCTLEIDVRFLNAVGSQKCRGIMTTPTIHWKESSVQGGHDGQFEWRCDNNGDREMRANLQQLAFLRTLKLFVNRSLCDHPQRFSLFAWSLVRKLVPTSLGSTFLSLTWSRPVNERCYGGVEAVSPYANLDICCHLDKHRVVCIAKTYNNLWNKKLWKKIELDFVGVMECQHVMNWFVKKLT